MIINKILEIINSTMDDSTHEFEKVTILDIEKDLTEMGMDSISFIRIIVALEEEFNCEIPDEKLLASEMNTVSKILNVINSTRK